MELLVIRRVILAVLLLGMIGLLAELLLLAHYEDVRQQIPLAILVVGLVAVCVNLVVRRPWSHLLLLLSMVSFVVAGVAGMLLHYQGSREFQIEMDPSLGGVDLIWHVLRAKSPPTLSPGTMVQMGILGLGYAYLRRMK